MKLKLKLNKILITVVALIIIFVAALYNGLVIRKYKLHTDKLDNDFKIVHISDLHSHFYGEKQEKIILKIAEQEPDIIFLTGDIIDDRPPYDGGVIFMQNVSKIAQTYYVTGNHEYWSDDFETIEKLIASTDVNVLNCEAEKFVVKGFVINIFGIHDPDIDGREAGRYDIWKENLAQLSMGLDNSEYNILLSHRSVFVDEFRKYDYDLIVSGHTHGGQARIPLILNGLLTPDQGWFPKYAGGLYEYGNTNHIISRGVSYNPRLPRVFNPPEIVVIELNN